MPAGAPPPCLLVHAVLPPRCRARAMPRLRKAERIHLCWTTLPSQELKVNAHAHPPAPSLAPLPPPCHAPEAQGSQFLPPALVSVNPNPKHTHTPSQDGVPSELEVLYVGTLTVDIGPGDQEVGQGFGF